MLLYEPVNFSPKELMSPEIYSVCGDDGLYMYSPFVLKGADMLFDAFGKMVCNTWHSKALQNKYGYFRFRGLRSKNQKIGAKLSAHKIGIKKVNNSYPGTVPYSGIDLWPTECKVQEIHAEIKKDLKYWSPYFKRIETHKPNGQPITWFHGDDKPDGRGKPIYFFKG